MQRNYHYRSYAQLTDDGLTEWHPAFLELATTLEECAKRYREFCKRYTPKKKKTTPRRNWGSCFLDKMTKGFQAKPKGREGVPGQLNLDLEGYQEVYQVDPLGSWFGSKAAHMFITANGAAMMG